MKKVLLSLTLFMASFFFITLDKVSAATVNQEITSDVMSWINDDFYSFREKLIELCKENNSYYVITHYNSTSSSFRAYVFTNKSQFYFASVVPNVEIHLYFNNSNQYKWENNEIVEMSTTGSNSYYRLYHYSSGYERFIIDSNFDLNYNLSYSIDYKYKDLTYSVTSGTIFPTLYKIYLDENPLPTDPFEEDKEILNNFYTTIFTKISDLAISFANIYTFLLIFGIFILIFVFELIWRRFI